MNVTAMQTPPTMPQPLTWSPASGAHPVQMKGSFPAWLDGDLVRTCPAVFGGDNWRANHWFDGLGVLYGFGFKNGAVTFQQQLLASDHKTHADGGGRGISQFGTPMKRGFFKRLFQPVPPLTDNANVNVVPWGDGYLAMTETKHQHLIDALTLKSTGTQTYADGLGITGMTAHPHFDAQRGALVNVGSKYGRKNELILYRQALGANVREVEARLAFDRFPYVHAFGLSQRYATVIDHPYSLNPMSMLWSERAFVEHFTWQPERGTRLILFDRAHGTHRTFETDALFTFHVVNQFEDGDDVVLDLLAYPDTSLVEQLSIQSMSRQLPALEAPLMRLRMKPGVSHVTPERIGTTAFEFPSINYRANSGLAYRYAWGSDISPNGTNGWSSKVVKVDTTTGDAKSFTEAGQVFGEPVFVNRPDAKDEDDGVLLTVATNHTSPKSTLFALSARSLEPLARAEVDLSIPLGFHGTFRRAKPV